MSEDYDNLSSVDTFLLFQPFLNFDFTVQQKKIGKYNIQKKILAVWLFAHEKWGMEDKSIAIAFG